MKKKYKTPFYVPHSKYTISIYDENNEFLTAFGNYKEVAKFLDKKEEYVVQFFSKGLKKMYCNHKKYFLVRTLNEKEKYRYGKNQVQKCDII